MRPMEGCNPASPRQLRQGRDVLTEDGAVAVDTRQISAASDAVVSREIHRKSECISTIVPKLAAAPQAASEVVQPRPRDSGCMNLLPPVGECLESLGMDTPDAVVSGMEVAGGSPTADNDISVGPDVLQTAVSVTTVVSEKWMEIDIPDAVVSGMEVAGGSPPADIDISGGPDVLQTVGSVTTVVSEKWMERFVIDLDVLCSDGLAFGDDPAGGSLDVGSDVCVVPDPIPTAVSVRTVVAEKWIYRFVLDLVECPSVSRTSAVAPTFGQAVPEEYSPVVFAWVEVADTYPLVVVESNTTRVSGLLLVESDTAQVSVLPVAGCKFPVVFFGKVALDVVGLGVGPPCLRVDSEETLLTLIDERAQLARAAPGVTPVDSSEEGAPVRELIRPSVQGEPLVDSLQEPMPVEKRLEYAIQATASVWEPLEQVHYVVSCDVNFD